MIGSVLAGVVAIGLVAWQADAVLGGGSGSGASSPGSSPYGSPTPLDGPTSPAATPTPLDSPYTPAGTPDDTPTPPASTPPEDSPSAPASDVTDLSGRWNGSYVCNQGITGLVLTIEDHGDGTVDAVFAFYPAPSNPQVPRGSFAMAGTLQSGVLTLRATRWIQQPPNFLAVNLQGSYDTQTPDHLDGRVYGPNCTTFSADRS